MRSPSFALSLCVASLITAVEARVVCADATPAGVWKTDFAAAQAEAKNLNRPLVVHFGATWCAPCRRMEKEVLHSSQVLKSLDAGFVAVKVDVDRNPKVQAKYRVENLPTDIIL